MKRTSTWASRLTALSTTVISLLLLQRLTHPLASSSVVLVVAIAVAGIGAAVKMTLHNCFESHLMVSLVAGATLVGTLLSVTLGLPGVERADLGPVHGALIALPVVALGLQTADARLHRRLRGERSRHTYAS